MKRGGTTQVAARVAGNDRVAYSIALVQWIAFHLAPVPIGWALKLVLDEVAAGGSTPWAPLAALAGLELGRWLLLIAAAVQWHGAYLGWLTVPRVNALRSLAVDPGPIAGRLPGSPGEAVSRFRDDAQDVGLLLDGSLDAAGSLAAAAAALVTMFAIAPMVAATVLVPVSIALALSWTFGPRMRTWRRAAREATGTITGFLGDTFGGVLAVKTAGAEEAIDARFAALNAARARASRQDRIGNELIRSLGYGTGEVAVGVMLLVAAGGLRRGELSVGDVAMFASFVPVIAGVPKWLGRLAAYHRQADVSIDRLAELLPEPDRLGVASPVTTHLRHGPPALVVDRAPIDQLSVLSVDDLVARHPSGRGLDGASFEVARGALVVVTGEVGAGKSTLLRAILGLVGVDGGTVSWNGRVIDDPSTFLVPPRAAYLPQVPRLFSESLRDTILLGLDGDDLERALWMTCLDTDLAGMPEGTDTVVGPRGLRLSGGQVQRAAAARALVRRPELLVIDDLSSALDVETEAQLWDRVVAGGFTTALIVSHRDEILGKADRVLRLVDGKIVD